jgi:DNA-binding transcriptional regulator YiaG
MQTDRQWRPAGRKHNVDMPNIASVLKDEIARVARKEVRAETETLKKMSAQHRNAIAALRRQITQLEKDLRKVTRIAGQALQAKASAVASPEAAPARRFSPTRLAAHRAKLGISAAAYGTLVGVSGATIYNWEQGKGRPGKEKLELLAATRSLSKSKALGQLASSQPRLDAAE